MKDTILVFYDPASANSPALLSGVMHYASRRGWRLHLLEGRRDADAAARAVDAYNPSGVLVGGLSGTFFEGSHTDIDGIPVVYIGNDVSPDGLSRSGDPTFSATQDSEETGRMAARELADLALASYGYVRWRRRAIWDNTRREGFCKELAALYPDDPDRATVSVCPTFDPETKGWSEELGKWLSALPRPAGVFAANDRTAWEVVLAAEQVGLSVPGDIAVIGADNDVSLCTNARPDITSVAPDFHRGGELAARLLDERMADPSLPPTVRWFRPERIVRRGSTDRMALGDPLVARARALIREKACDGLRARDVVSALHGSRRHAERRFREVAGRSILDEISEVRLERAKAMLSSGNLSVSAVAGLCGWASESHFRRAFQAKTGMTPSAWRARAGADIKP